MKQRSNRNADAPILPRTTDVSSSTIRAITEADEKAERAARRAAREKAAQGASPAEKHAATPYRGVPRQKAAPAADDGDGATTHRPKLRLRRGSILSDARDFLRQCGQYVHLKFLSFNIEKEWVFRVLIVTALVILFAVMETTFAARFPLFGQTPDLMLGLVIAVAMTEGEQFGALTGLFGGLVIDALGLFGMLPLSALLYVPVGYVAGALTENYFTGNIPVRALYTLAAGIPRAILTVIVLRLGGTVASSMTSWQMISGVLFPGFFSTALCAVFPHLAAWLCLRPFHKTRAERIR